MTFARWLALVDALVIAVAAVLAYQVRVLLGETVLDQAFGDAVPVALAIIPMWLALLYLAGAYRPEYLNSAGDAFRRFSAGAVGGAFTLGFLSFLLNLQLSRLFVALVFVFAFTLGGMTRIVVRSYLRYRYRRGDLVQNVLIVGANDEGVQLGRAIAEHPGCGYRVVGYLDEARMPSRAGALRILGPPSHVLEVAQDLGVGLVVVSPTGVSPGTLQDVTITLEGSPIDLAVAPSLFQVVTRRMTVESIANIPILHVDQVRLTGGKALLKRTEDLLVAAVLFVLTLPLVILLMGMVRLESRGPAIFVQERVGKDGRPIRVLKLRTMVDGAEAMKGALQDQNEAEGVFFKIRADPRVTRVGRVLRRFSLDELPQLWNVLRGEMSMVGPRPPTSDEVRQYEPWHLRRLRVRPGITGVWQTGGRSDVSFDEAVRLDLFYIENWSLGYDIFLLGKTVVAMLSGRGAY